VLAGRLDEALYGCGEALLVGIRSVPAPSPLGSPPLPNIKDSVRSALRTLSSLDYLLAGHSSGHAGAGRGVSPVAAISCCHRDYGGSNGNQDTPMGVASDNFGKQIKHSDRRMPLDL
jgi:hypothetical protein